MRPRKTRRIRPIWAGSLAAAALLAAAAVVAVQSDGSAVRGAASFRGARVVPSFQLRATRVRTDVRLPAAASAISFDLRLATGSELDVAIGSGSLVITRGARGAPQLVGAHRTFTLGPRRGWPAKEGSLHVEMTSSPARLGIDGQQLPATLGRGGRLSFALRGGRADVDALIVTPLADRAALLLHRLAELHARAPSGQFPIGADASDKLHFDRNWMIGFWAGSLWQAAAIGSFRDPFTRWALKATTVGFHPNGAPSHDLGFQYGQSWQAAWESLCSGKGRSPSICPRLRRTALGAAEKLFALAATNAAAGTIPVIGKGSVAVTIIDSMMNLDLLAWAGRVTGDPKYDRLVSRHAHTVASVLVRGDGSTAQAVNYDRASGLVLSVGTHQGLSATSTWSRGQAWAVYGFAQTAASLRDRALLAVAERVADYVARRLPSGGIPPWDYDAPAGAPVDVSAGVITSAGMLRLARACGQMPGVCVHAGSWAPLARRMLATALDHASAEPPLGMLSPQLLNERNPPCWCNHGELTFGVDYALEAATHGAA